MVIAIIGRNSCSGVDSGNIRKRAGSWTRKRGNINRGHKRKEIVDVIGSIQKQGNKMWLTSSSPLFVSNTGNHSSYGDFVYGHFE